MSMVSPGRLNDVVTGLSSLSIVVPFGTHTRIAGRAVGDGSGVGRARRIEFDVYKWGHDARRKQSDRHCPLATLLRERRVPSVSVKRGCTAHPRLSSRSFRGDAHQAQMDFCLRWESASR